MHTNRMHWVDFLKIIAIFAVILIHSAAPLVITTVGSIQWWAGNFYDSVSRWCIPVFFMLSGAILLERAQTGPILSFLYRRFWKVFFPLVIWSVIYFYWRVYVNNEHLVVTDIVKLFFTEPVYYHLWFMYVIVEFYLVAPLIAVFVHNADKSRIHYFILLWLIFGSLLPLSQLYFDYTTYFSILEGQSVSRYIGYVVLGWYLKDTTLKGRDIAAAAVVFICTVLATMYGTYVLNVHSRIGLFDDIFYDYTGILVMTMSVAIYVTIKSIPFSKLTRLKGVSIVVIAISDAVFGIYLVHALVISALKNGRLAFTFTESAVHPIIGIPLFSMCVFVISLVLVLIIRRIPIVNSIVP